MCEEKQELRSWEKWLNDHEYVVWPVIGGVSLLVMFWLTRYV